MTEQQKTRMQRRLSENAPYVTPGEWYHEDVPMLLRALIVAEKTCPNGGNDGYVTPIPCQLEIERNDFTDRIRMEIIPELEERLNETKKAINGNKSFTIDYRSGVKDNLLCAVDLLNEILDSFDEAERQLDEVQTND